MIKKIEEKGKQKCQEGEKENCKRKGKLVCRIKNRNEGRNKEMLMMEAEEKRRKK